MPMAAAQIQREQQGLFHKQGIERSAVALRHLAHEGKQIVGDAAGIFADTPLGRAPTGLK